MIVKPFNFSILTRPFEMNNRFYHCTASVCCFSFSDNIPDLLPETELWKFTEKEIGKETPIDIIMPKAKGEVVITGRYFTQNKNETGGEAGFSLGEIKKSLYVIGDRRWIKNANGVYSFTDPLPFSEMPIDYYHAYGGENYKLNPLGKGFIQGKSQNDLSLPNIENPQKLVTSITDTPEPIGFGPIDMTWPQRAGKTGTYDNNWYQKLYPGLATDMDPSYFNIAPFDQWSSSYFKGDESFSLYGMNRLQPVINGKLPSFRPRCFISYAENADSLLEINLNLDTVWFFPHCEKAIIIWHGVTEIKTDDADDVKHIISGYEHLDQAPKSAEQYRSALKKRLDKEHGHFYAIYEKDIIPDGEKPGLFQLLSKTDYDHALMINQKKKAESELVNAKKQSDAVIASLPSAALPLEIPDINNIENSIDLKNYNPETIIAFIKKQQDDAAALKEKTLQEVELKKKKLFSAFKQICDKTGKDYDKEIDSLTRLDFKRPVFDSQALHLKLASAKNNLIEKLSNYKLNDGTIVNLLSSDPSNYPISESLLKNISLYKKILTENDPALFDQLKTAQAFSKSTYVRTAHLSKTKPQLTPEKKSALKEQFLSDLSNNSCAGKDYAGIDLSSITLDNVDLTDCYFEGSDFSNTIINNAIIKGTVFANALLNNVSFKKTTIDASTFGEAKLDNAFFSNCTIKDTVFTNVSLLNARFDFCSFAPSDISGASFSKTTFNSSEISDCYFLETAFPDCSFNDSTLIDIIFYKCILPKVSFVNTKMPKTQFIESDCSNALFTNADLSNSNFINKCILTGTDFSFSNLENANLMESDCMKAKFVRANLKSTNLMKANCKNADFTGSKAIRAMLQKGNFDEAVLKGADCFEANLRHASFVNSDLSDASLYSAEVMRITVGNTNFLNTNLSMTKLDKQDRT